LSFVLRLKFVAGVPLVWSLAPVLTNG
jgi:hypothetical protein